jgi:hypothetical protein
MPTRIAESLELFVTPMVVAEGTRINLLVSGDYTHTQFLPHTEYAYSIKSMYVVATSPRRKGALTGISTANDDGALEIPFSPDTSGAWILNVESENDTRKHMPITLALYVMPRELDGYRGYIGELHAHSTSSDGKQMPAYPPMRARTYGYDFFTLTDHWCYESSIEMIRIASEALGSQMLLLNGEEMHPEREDYFAKPEDQPHVHHYHYTAIGNSESVRDAFLKNPEASQREVSAIAKEITNRGVNSQVDLNAYAEGVWKVRKAKSLGGIAIYAHPYWATPINLDRGAIEQTFRDREVDAVEATSPADLSTFTTNRLMMPDLVADPIPVVGVSDSHNWDETVPCKSFTLVMAEELNKEALFESIRAGRSVACRVSDPALLVGPFPVADFANFYIDHILPRRRRITSLQGNIALSKLRGGAFSSELIETLDRDLASLDAAIWGAAG